MIDQISKTKENKKIGELNQTIALYFWTMIDSFLINFISFMNITVLWHEAYLSISSLLTKLPGIIKSCVNYSITYSYLNMNIKS